jgi:hypothetical protein
MAAASQRQRGVIDEASERVGQTMQASVTEPPGKPELALDAAMLAATVVGAVSPPVALAGMALNRLVHVAK